MTPVRAATIVRGDVPGLLRRGMPVTFIGEGLDGEPVECVGVVLDDAEPNTTWRVANLTDGVPADLYGDETRAMQPIWTDPAALYLSLHWLADRGHLCGWMLPATHGGRVAEWDGLTAWEVAAVLVSHEVALRAAGRAGIKHLLADYRPEVLVGLSGRAEYLSRWVIGGVRRIGPPRVVTVGPDGWHYDRAVLARGVDIQTCDYDKGPETGDAGKLAADRAAVADGCCLQVPGGLVVPT